MGPPRRALADATQRKATCPPARPARSTPEAPISRSARFVLVPALLLALSSAAPGRALTCKTLTPEEAATLLGPAPALRTALEGGGCIYERGDRTLTVAQPATLDDRQVVVQAYEAQMASQQGKPLAGIGDRAFLAKGNSGWRIGLLKGKTLGGLEVYGEGTDDPETGRKLEAAAKFVAERL